VVRPAEEKISRSPFFAEMVNIPSALVVVLLLAPSIVTVTATMPLVVDLEITRPVTSFGLSESALRLRHEIQLMM
jgi:hypothetical protein